MARKLGARQQRIADKYAHILKALEVKEKVGVRKYNKSRSLTQELKTLSRKHKRLGEQIAKLNWEDAPGSIVKPIIRESHRVQNQLRETRRTKYEIELDMRVSGGFIEVQGKRIDLNFEELTEEQTNTLRRLERSLEEYSTGNMNITKFYNDYEFDVINETSLRLFAEGEGLI